MSLEINVFFPSQDVIIHVYDASHPDKVAQIDHVRKTLKSLTDGDRPLVEVANKCDLIEPGELPEDQLGISATQSIGTYKSNKLKTK